MRIPPSVFVMTVITVVPFGLGIRDSLRERAPRAERESEADRKGREYDDYEAAMRRDAEERERLVRERKERLDTLFGREPASMGSLFEGVELGAEAGRFQPEDLRHRIANATRDGFIEVYFDSHTDAFNGIEVRIGRDYDPYVMCTTLVRKLVDAWGTADVNSWVNPATRQRATVDTTDGCSLFFYKYLDPDEWVSAIPFDAIGKPATPFIASLGSSATHEDSRVYWYLPGLMYGRLVAHMTAAIDTNRVTGIEVIFDLEESLLDEVRGAISARVQVQPKQMADGDWTWKWRAPMVLEALGNSRFALYIGRKP